MFCWCIPDKEDKKEVKKDKITQSLIKDGFIAYDKTLFGK